MMRMFKAVALCTIMLASVGFLLAQAAREKGAGSKPPASEVTKGKAVFEENCGICHYASSTKKKIGPGLKGLYKRGKFTDGEKVDDASLRAWIEKGGTNMPPFKDTLSKQQLADLISYLKTL